MPTHRTESASTSRRRGASRSNANARAEVLGMLEQDHKKAKKAFRDFARMDPDKEAEECEALVQQTCAELEVHATLEEELFYPAARKAISDEDLIEEAEVEHGSQDALIQQLKGMDLDDEKFSATFTVLGEYTKHHIKEEEGEMFKQLTGARVDWSELLEEMRARRQQLMQEKGLPSEADGADGAAE
jgi:hypothetical protein